VPGENGIEYLRKMVERGVEVSILTNSLAATDVVAVHSGYAPYRKPLLAAGITLYETKVTANFKPSAWRGSTQASLHAKSIIFDKKHTFVGSLNLDPRSIFINTEIGVLFENVPLSEKIHNALSDAISDSAYQVKLNDNKLEWIDLKTKNTFTSEPDASIWRKIGACFFGILPIEDQL
jgi:putative cardiolipin synthase